MNFNRSRLLLVLAGFVVIVGLPFAGKWLRGQRGPRCELDGLKIEARYQVRVVDRIGGSHRFCCIHCASLWLARQSERPEVVYVTDEASGAEIDARASSFVRSDVVTNPVTGNRIHAFRDPSDADEHARAFRGWLIDGAERPFRQSAPRD